MSRSRRALVRRAVLTVALALASGCAQEAVPLSLYGTWAADDARYAGRTLEIGRFSLRFLEGQRELDSIRILGVDAEIEPGTPERFVISGEARDGSAVELALVLQTHPVERLRFETQAGYWHRAAPRPLGGTS